jgi:hypothetical protein
MALTKVKTQMINPDATRIVQDRSRIDYQTPTSVKCYVPENIVMGGFRFMGSYKKGNGLYISSGVGTNGWLEVSQTTDLAFEATPHYENWYAVFALANDGDSVATMKHVPFFRAASVSTNVITLAQGGESDGDTVTATTYNIATNALVGAEVLIIQEGRQFSGKTTTVTANTNSTITVANASSMGANDFLLFPPQLMIIIVIWDHGILTQVNQETWLMLCKKLILGVWMLLGFPLLVLYLLQQGIR